MSVNIGFALGRARDLRHEVVHIKCAMRNHANAEVDDDNGKCEDIEHKDRKSKGDTEHAHPQSRPAAIACQTRLIPQQNIEEAIDEQIDAERQDSDGQRLSIRQPEGEPKQQGEHATYDIEDPRAFQHPGVETIHAPHPVAVRWKDLWCALARHPYAAYRRRMGARAELRRVLQTVRRCG
jgi:hypothetical protein